MQSSLHHFFSTSPNMWRFQQSISLSSHSSLFANSLPSLMLLPMNSCFLSSQSFPPSSASFSMHPPPSFLPSSPPPSLPPSRPSYSLSPSTPCTSEHVTHLELHVFHMCVCVCVCKVKMRTDHLIRPRFPFLFASEHESSCSPSVRRLNEFAVFVSFQCCSVFFF